MARSYSAATLAALQARALVMRDFLWIVARNRTTGALVPAGFWSDVGPITAQVIDPDLGAPVARAFTGSGSLIQISDIPLVSNITVQEVTIDLSQIADAVANAVRIHDVKFAPVQIHRGLFSPETRLLVAPAACRFVGLVDRVDITTPTENEAGSCTLTCVSHTQEMTRSNPAKRSDDDQRLRSPTDNFLQDVQVVGDWSLPWGTKGKKIDSKKARS